MKPVIIDTSIAIDILRAQLEPQDRRKIKGKTIMGEVFITKLIWAELHTGIRGKREERDFEEFLMLYPVLVFDDLCWDLTARIGRRCHRFGVNVPLSDIQIQACADRYGFEVFHNDRHFDLIQSTAS